MYKLPIEKSRKQKEPTDVRFKGKKFYYPQEKLDKVKNIKEKVENNA